jgi:hypothetical protein
LVEVRDLLLVFAGVQAGKGLQFILEEIDVRLRLSAERFWKRMRTWGSIIASVAGLVAATRLDDPYDKIALGIGAFSVTPLWDIVREEVERATARAALGAGTTVITQPMVTAPPAPPVPEPAPAPVPAPAPAPAPVGRVY